MQLTKTTFALEPQTQADPARAQAVAREFEGQFAQLLVKSMRQASFGDSLFPGENRLYREMYDAQVAKALTQGNGLGLAPMIARQLLGAESGKPTPSTTYPLSDYARPLPARRADAEVPTLPTGGADAAAPPSAVRRLLAMEQALIDDDGAPDRSAQELGTSTACSDAATASTWGLPRGSPERFVAEIWPHAQRAAAELGVCPRVLVAQAALETGWGRRVIRDDHGTSAHNLFGIKAGGRWAGVSVSRTTHEYAGGVARREAADFRAYGSAAEGFADYVRLLKTSPRYAQALSAGTDTRRFAGALQRAGYATDPAYAAKITAIAEGPTLGRALAALVSGPSRG